MAVDWEAFSITEFVKPLQNPSSYIYPSFFFLQNHFSHDDGINDETLDRRCTSPDFLITHIDSPNNQLTDGSRGQAPAYFASFSTVKLHLFCLNHQTGS